MSLDDPSTRSSGQSTRIARLATLATFCALGVATIVYVAISEKEERTTTESARGPARPAAPVTEPTSAEIEASRALASEEQRDSRSVATAQALARLALAHGRAGHVEEAEAVYTRLLRSTKWLGVDELPGINLPEDLVRHFDKEGRISAADSMQAHAYEKRRQILGRKHALTLEALRELASRQTDAGRYLQAEPLLRELDALAGEFSLFRREQGPLSDPNAILCGLSDVYRDLERPRERAAVVARLFKTKDAGEWADELPVRDAIEIALVFQETGALDTAIDVLGRAANTGSGEGPMLVRKIALAWLKGRAAEVEALERELIARNPLGPASTAPAAFPRASTVSPEVLFAETLDALCQLGDFYRRIGRLDQEVRINGEIANFIARGRPNTPTATPAVTSLALAYRRAQHWEEAERYHVELLRLLKNETKPDERAIDYAMARLAAIYQRQGRNAETVELYRTTVERVSTQRGAHDWLTMFLRRRLGEIHARQGNLDAAERQLSELLRYSLSVRGSDSEMTAETMEQLALIHRQQKNFERAAQLLVELLPIEQRRIGSEHPGTLFVRRLLGEVRREQGRFAEARALHERVRADLVRVHGIGHRDAPEAFRALAQDYMAENDFVRAADVYLDATRQIPNSHHVWNSLAWFRATAPAASARDAAVALSAAQKACELSGWADAFCLSSLAAAHAEAGDFERAVEHQRQAIAVAELTEQQRGEWEARLALYLERKPYRQPGQAAPGAR